MLSIIVCSISPQLLDQLSQSIDATVGVEHEIIAIDNRITQYPIARAYNEGAKRARFPYLFFVHEDVLFHTEGWGKVLCDKLSEPDCGVIGFAGSKVKFASYSGWVQGMRWAHALYYQGDKGKSQLLTANVLAGHPFEQVVTVDGMAMLVRKEVWEEYPFDEAMLTGFHCYDIDFSLQIAASGRYKNYVCCTPKAMMEHLSKGNYNSGWCQDTLRLHDSKWHRILPIYVPSLSFTPAMLRYHEERAFHRFVRKMLKTDIPERRKVLKSFLFYPCYSPKHMLHCVQNVLTYLFIRPVK